MICLDHWADFIHFFFRSISVPDLRKSLTIAFRWYFIGIFLRTRSWHYWKYEKQKKIPVGKRCWSSFIFRNGRSEMSKQTRWWHRARKSARHVFMLSTDQYKILRHIRFSTVGYVCSTQTTVIFNPAVWYIVVAVKSSNGQIYPVHNWLVFLVFLRMRDLSN